jgi:hypothetical protein
LKRLRSACSPGREVRRIAGPIRTSIGSSTIKPKPLRSSAIIIAFSSSVMSRAMFAVIA